MYLRSKTRGSLVAAIPRMRAICPGVRVARFAHPMRKIAAPLRILFAIVVPALAFLQVGPRDSARAAHAEREPSPIFASKKSLESR